MNTSWTNTRKALTNFANVLRCYKCGNKPINAVRYTNCGHYFCTQCIIGEDSNCIICNTPVQPMEICNDHLIRSLVSYCNIVGDIIQEKDLWGATRNLDAIQLVTATISTPNGNNVRYRIPKKNINKLNYKGESKLHVACLKKCEDYVKVLLAAGANPNTKDHAGWTPLQEVVSFGYANLCKLLLECGASPDTPGTGNRRALHDAAMKNRLVEAKMLLEYSANKNVYDDHGNRPIDYCQAYSEMWFILKADNELNDTTEGAMGHNSTLNQSLSATQPFVIYASNLLQENKRYLHQMVSKHKIKVVSEFRSSVTHIIVETNNGNVVQLTYDVMLGLLRGCCLLNTEWIQLGMDMVDVLKGDLEIFEISGSPLINVPKIARENAQKQNPGLFKHCHFYFALQAKNSYCVNNIELTKDALVALVREGDGTILKREPDPEDINADEQLIPFHVANEPNHPLYKCTHFVVYAPGRDEPRVKYNMLHIKTLPLMWLIECVEKFTLVDPSQLGLLKF